MIEQTFERVRKYSRNGAGKSERNSYCSYEFLNFKYKGGLRLSDRSWLAKNLCKILLPQTALVFYHNEAHNHNLMLFLPPKSANGRS